MIFGENIRFYHPPPGRVKEKVCIFNIVLGKKYICILGMMDGSKMR